MKEKATGESRLSNRGQGEVAVSLGLREDEKKKLRFCRTWHRSACSLDPAAGFGDDRQGDQSATEAAVRPYPGFSPCEDAGSKRALGLQSFT